MSDFEQGINLLEEAARQRLVERGKRTGKLLDREALLGSKLRTGDRVLDKVTRREGRVISIGVRNLTVPPAGRQGG